MNLTTLYRARTLWHNVIKVEISRRTTTGWIKEFVRHMGAPEVVGKSKKYAITLSFGYSITEELLNQLLQLEYNTIEFKYEYMGNMLFVRIEDASLVNHFTHMLGLQVIELTAANIEIKPIMSKVEVRMSL